MDLETIAPPLPREKRRLRRGARIVIGITVLIVVGLGVAGGLVLRYQPLGYFGGRGSCDVPGSVTPTRVQTFNFGDECQFRAERSKLFGHGFDLTNDGPWSVRIVGIAIGGIDGGFRGESVTVRSSGDRGESPFRPFTLEPERSAFITMRYRFADCDFPTNDTSEVVTPWDTVSVRFEFAGRTRTAVVSLPDGIAVRTAGNGCPRDAA